MNEGTDGGTTEGTSRLGRYLVEDEANAAARVLLEAGVTPVVEREVEPISQRRVWWVSVFAHDLPRAGELLGVSLPEAATASFPAPTAADQELTKEQTRWRIPPNRVWVLIVGYLILLAVVSVGAFWATVTLLDSDDTDPTVPPGDPAVTLPGG